MTTTLNQDLHIACMLNNADRVTSLLARGASPSAKNTTGTTVLEMADFLRRLDIAKLLLATMDIESVGAFELFKAIRGNRSTVVRALLELGVKDQLTDQKFYCGVLLLACVVGSPAVLEALVRYGPGFSVSRNEEVLLQVASVAGNMDLVEFITAFAEEERKVELGDGVGNV